MSRLYSHEQKQKLRISEAVCTERRTYRFKREGREIILSLDSTKVEEGQRINVGDIISVRTTERTKLQAKKQRLESSLARVRLPLKELKPVPIPKFQTELAALKQAQFKLDSIVQQIDNFDQKFYHKDPWHVQVFESEKVQELAELKRQELAASINVERAIATLDEAKLNYQKQQYEHSLKVSDYQTSLHKQQEQIKSLQSQLYKVDEELEQLTSVYWAIGSNGTRTYVKPKFVI